MPSADADTDKPWKRKKKPPLRPKNSESAEQNKDNEKPWKKKKKDSTSSRGKANKPTSSSADEEKPWRKNKKKQPTDSEKPWKKKKNKSKDDASKEAAGGSENELTADDKGTKKNRQRVAAVDTDEEQEHSEEKPWKKGKKVRKSGSNSGTEDEGRKSAGGTQSQKDRTKSSESDDKPWRKSKKKKQDNKKESSVDKDSEDPETLQSNSKHGADDEKPWRRKSKKSGKSSAASAEEAEESNRDSNPSNKEKSSSRPKKTAPNDQEKPWRRKKGKDIPDSEKPWKKKKAKKKPKDSTSGEGNASSKTENTKSALEDNPNKESHENTEENGKGAQTTEDDRDGAASKDSKVKNKPRENRVKTSGNSPSEEETATQDASEGHQIDDNNSSEQKSTSRKSNDDETNRKSHKRESETRASDNSPSDDDNENDRQQEKRKNSKKASSTDEETQNAKDSTKVVPGNSFDGSETDPESNDNPKTRRHEANRDNVSDNGSSEESRDDNDGHGDKHVKDKKRSIPNKRSSAVHSRRDTESDEDTASRKDTVSNKAPSSSTREQPKTTDEDGIRSNMATEHDRKKERGRATGGKGEESQPTSGTKDDDTRNRTENVFLDPTDKIKAGDDVIVNYKGRGKWFHAQVVNVQSPRSPRAGLSFDVVFANGKTQQGVTGDKIRKPEPPNAHDEKNVPQRATNSTHQQGGGVDPQERDHTSSTVQQSEETVIQAHIDRVANEMTASSNSRDFKTAKHRKKELSILDKHLKKLRLLVPKMEEHAKREKFDKAEAVHKNITKSRAQMDKDLAKHLKKFPDLHSKYLDDPFLHPKAPDPRPDTNKAAEDAQKKESKKKSAKQDSSSSSGSSSSGGSSSSSESSDSDSSGGSDSSSTDSSESGSISSVSSSDETGKQAPRDISKGSRVLYTRSAGARAKKAVVLKKHRDGSFDIKLDGSDRLKEHVEAKKLTMDGVAKGRSGKATARDLSIGDSIEAFVRVKGQKKKVWTRAKVVDVSAAEKMVAVKFLFEPKNNVHKTLELSDKHVRFSADSKGEVQLELGSNVQVQPNGHGPWLNAKITRERGGDIFDVFIAATSETKRRIHREFIRPAPESQAMINGEDIDSIEHKTRVMQEGALVQYRDMGDWVNAVVTRVYRNRRRGTTLFAIRVEHDKTIRSDVGIDELRVRSVFDKIEEFYVNSSGGRGVNGIFSVSRDSGRLIRLAAKLSRKVRIAQDQGIVDDLQHLFRSSDKDADGFLCADELQDFLQVLRLKRIQQRDCEDLITLFNAGDELRGNAQKASLVVGGPVLSWTAFLRLTGVYDQKSPAIRAQKIASVAGKVRTFFQHLLDRRDSDGLFRTFEDLDASGQGVLSYSAFHYGLANMGLQLKADEAVLICDQYDPEDEGTIDYKKFLRFCTSDEEGAEAMVDFIRDRLMQECKTRAGHYDTKKLFSRLAGSSSHAGRDDGGQNTLFLSWHDFYHHCSQKYGLHLAAPRRRRLQKELRVSRSGRISYKSFCEFLGVNMSAEELGMVPMQVDPSKTIKGHVFYDIDCACAFCNTVHIIRNLRCTLVNRSVGDWIEHVASHTERVNYFHLLQVLDDFERSAGLQQSRDFDDDKDDMLQSLTIQLGSRLKCSLQFHL